MSDPLNKPPTLAALRARGVKLRASKPRAGLAEPTGPGLQADLFALAAGAGSPPYVFPVEEGSPRASARSLVQDASRLQAAAPDPPKTSHTVRDAAQERRIWSVRALVSDICQQVEISYADLWVEGEISNCRPASSGHTYFTLKDGEAQLPVVLFRRQGQLLRFRPADGLAVLVRGRISVYESRGQLQLIAQTMEPRGTGALQLAFEQLKARLLAEGLFDTSRKRALPAFPHCVGIITSAAGAVIRDIVTVVRRRHARLNLLVYPAVMQGSSSPNSVAAGIRWFNAHRDRADLIILARGGGSMEDLACFNEEALARIIAASGVPVVTAIGHETDFTIADFVADLRAPTPSAAAELVTAGQHRIEERVEALAARVHRAGSYHLVQARQRYTRLSAESVLARLHDGVDRRDQRLDELRLRLESLTQRRLKLASQRLLSLGEHLRRQNPSVRLASTQRRLQASAHSLQQLAALALAVRQARLTRASTRLEALSPVAVLSRGYALIYSHDGRLLRSAAETAPGEAIHARLGQGSLAAQVTSLTPHAATDTMTRADWSDRMENGNS